MAIYLPVPVVPALVVVVGANPKLVVFEPKPEEAVLAVFDNKPNPKKNVTKVCNFLHNLALVYKGYVPVVGWVVVVAWGVVPNDKVGAVVLAAPKLKPAIK